MFTIRPAIAGDHRRLEALQSRASLATGEHVQDLLDNPDALEIPFENLAHSLVAEMDGEILGFCTVLPVAPDFAEVDAVFVEPSVWRAGIGRTLLSAAGRDIAARGVAALGVVSGLYAEPFYQSLGFEKAGSEMTRFGPATRLIKPLAAAGAGLATPTVGHSR